MNPAAGNLLVIQFTMKYTQRKSSARERDIPMSTLIGQSLGRYHILEQLGEGGMATVYKAYDTRLETDVAVKVIRTENILPSVLEKSLKRFEREAKSLAKLTHPNIVKVTDYGEHEGKPYLVMSYLPGGTLKERLKSGAIPWQEAVQLLVPIAHALEYAHEHNLIHRDVKPSNILLTEKGQPMLTDFGVAKLFDVDETAELTGTGMGIGTPEYMAPEQWTGHVTPQTDIYALGIVFYEMVTGRKPYMADTPAALLLKQANDPLPRPRSFVAGLPDAVEKVLFKALAKGLEDRYQGMGEMVKAMEGLLAGKQVKEARPVRKKEETLTAVDFEPDEKTQVDEKPIIREKSTRRGWGWGVVAAGIGMLLFGVLSLSKINLFAISPTSTPSPSPTPFGGSGKIAFVSDGIIYTINPDGSGLVKLTNNTWVESFSWSPDGSRLVFASRDGADGGWDSSRIYIVDSSGDDQKKLTEVPGRFPVWSPDGSMIVFVSIPVNASFGDLYSIKPDGTELRQLNTSVKVGGWLRWSPDSTKVVFHDQNFQIMVLDVGGGSLTRLTNDRSRNFYASWSPDGQRIAYMNENNILYSMNYDGSDQRKIVDSVPYVREPLWSPDGKRILFGCHFGIEKIWSEIGWLLCVVDADGGNMKQLTFAGDIPGYGYAWSPDGQYIVFSLDMKNGDRMQLHLINVDGTNLTDLASSIFDKWAPVWVP